MSRVDNWTKDEDLLLSETVLRHIRQGSTQLKAFDEVGEKLNRSSAGCAFRWNGIVRHNYTEAILFAKKLRNDNKRMNSKEKEVVKKSEPLKKEVIKKSEPLKKGPRKMEVVCYLVDLMWEFENKPTHFHNIKEVIKCIMEHKEA